MIGALPASLLDSWVLIRGADLRLAGEEPPYDAVVFLYIDHQAGISMKLKSLCRSNGGALELYGTRYLEHGTLGATYRFGTFSLAGARPLSESEVPVLRLPAKPDWLSFYHPEKHEWQRSDDRLDSFRNVTFPDDVEAIFLPNETGPVERVWVRLEGPFAAEGFEDHGFGGVLLNEPSDTSSSLGRGDVVILRLTEQDDRPMLLLVGKLKRD